MASSRCLVFDLRGADVNAKNNYPPSFQRSEPGVSDPGSSGSCDPSIFSGGQLFKPVEHPGRTQQEVKALGIHRSAGRVATDHTDDPAPDRSRRRRECPGSSGATRCLAVMRDQLDDVKFLLDHGANLTDRCLQGHAFDLRGANAVRKPGGAAGGQRSGLNALDQTRAGR